MFGLIAALCPADAFAATIIEVDKEAQELQAHVGDTVHYTFHVSDLGSTSFSTVQVSDPKCTVSSSPVSKENDNGDAILNPLGADGTSSEVWNYECNHVVAAGDGDPLHNTATVTGTDVSAGMDTDTDTWDVDVLHPDIELDKQAQESQTAVGATVHYSFGLTNPGDVPLSVQFSDPKCDIGTLGGFTGDTNANDKLDITETWTSACTRLVASADGDPVHNTAVAIGTDVLGGNDSDSDSVDVDIPNALSPPALTPIDNSALRAQCIKKAKRKFKKNPARKKAIAKCRQRFP